MWTPFFSHAIPTYRVLPYSMIYVHQSLADMHSGLPMLIFFYRYGKLFSPTTPNMGMRLYYCIIVVANAVVLWPNLRMQILKQRFFHSCGKKNLQGDARYEATHYCCPQQSRALDTTTVHSRQTPTAAWSAPPSSRRARASGSGELC